MIRAAARLGRTLPNRNARTALQCPGAYAAGPAMFTTAPQPRATIAGRNSAVVFTTAAAFRSTSARTAPRVGLDDRTGQGRARAVDHDVHLDGPAAPLPGAGKAP